MANILDEQPRGSLTRQGGPTMLMNSGITTGRSRSPGSRATVGRVDFAAGPVETFHAVRFTRRFPPHFHDTFAIGAVESGGIRLQTARGESIVLPGSLITLSPGEMHAALPLGPEGYTYRMIYPGPAFMAETGLTPSANHVGGFQDVLPAPVTNDVALGRRFLILHRRISAEGAGSVREEELLALVRALGAQHRRHTTRWATLRPADIDIVQRVRSYLAGCFTQRISLDTLAEECRITRFHLIRVFKRVIGIAPHAYVVQLRLNKARTLLRTGEKLAEVAYMCGFSDQSHLTRTFRNAHGVTPGQYVRQVRHAAA